MGNRERSKDPPADVAIDGWFDLLDDEADASAPRPTQRPTKSPQGPNLSALNEISNKVTPVMLSPVHHLLPAIEPTHLSNEPRDVWETDVGSELDSFFAVPPANAAPRAERKSDPDPAAPTTELSEDDGEEFLDFGDTLGVVTDASPPPSREVTPAAPTGIRDFADGPEFEPAAPPPTPPVTTAQRLPDPAGVPTSTPLPETLLQPRSVPPPGPALVSMADEDAFDLSDFDRWGKADDDVTPAAGFQAFAKAPDAPDPLAMSRTIAGLVAPLTVDARAAEAPAPAPVEASASPVRPASTTRHWGEPAVPAPAEARSTPPLPAGAAPWARPASPSRRPTLTQSIHEAPTPVRPPPLPHLHASAADTPPPAPPVRPPQSPPRPTPALNPLARATPIANPSPARLTSAINPPPRGEPIARPTPPRAMPVPAAPTVAARKLSPRQEMHERFDLGDFTGALVLAETILEVDEADRDATHVAEVCRAKLRAIYIGRLGSLDQVPVLAVAPSEFRWLALDHRAGFLLSLVDGSSTLEDIVDVSAMPQLEALRTLHALVTQQIITLRWR
jgi:hypothetical protein